MPSNLTIRYEQINLEAAKLRKSADSLQQALKATEDKIGELYAEIIMLPKPLPIVDTEWAKSFKETNPNQYLEALEYALHPYFTVKVYLSDQLESPMWAILAVIDGVETDFWMSGFVEEADAWKLCEDMGWKCL